MPERTTIRRRKIVRFSDGNLRTKGPQVQRLEDDNQNHLQPSTPEGREAEVPTETPQEQPSTGENVDPGTTAEELSPQQGADQSEDRQVNKTDSPDSDRSEGHCFITSRHFLKDKLPRSRKAFDKQVYFVSSSPEPHKQPQKRCTNVTAVLNKPIVTAIVDNPYARVDSAYSSRYSPRSYSGDSIRLLARKQEPITMSYKAGEIYTMHTTTLSRSQEKEELQRINDRLAMYVQKVRQLREQSHHLDSTSLIKSTKILEDEVVNLKNLYEKELENARKQLEECTRERNSYQMQCSKNQQTAADLESRLMIETEKNRKMIDEMNVCQRRMQSLEAELNDVRFANKPLDDSHLQRDIDNLTRENENLKRRCEKEQLMRQEAEEKAYQITKKFEFNEQVHLQQVNDLRDRFENSTATILSLESRIRDLSKSDSSIPELIRQVREAGEEELRKYQIESEATYTRNITSLKAQMDNDAKSIERINTEKSQLLGSIGELRAKITSLEGQIHNLQHQKLTLEEMLKQEKSRCSEQLQMMDKKLRDVQELLFVKMREANISRDVNLPLKTEIEALKVILEEEERRLQLPVETTVTTTHMSHTHTSPTPVTSAIQVSHPQPSAPPASAAYMHTTGTSGYDTAYNYSATNFEPINTVPAELDFDFIGGGTKYTYETTPSVNKLQIEPSPPVTPRPVGPISRVKSAPDEGQYLVKSTRWNKSKNSNAGKKIGRYQIVSNKQRGPSVVCGTGGKCHDTRVHFNHFNDNYGKSYNKYDRAKTYYPRATGAGGRTMNPALIPTSLGQGRDYFDEMFRDLNRETLYTPTRPKSSPVERQQQSSVCHDYTTSTSRSEIVDIPPCVLPWDGAVYSAIGDIKVVEVNQEGKYVRLVNEGKQEYEFGGYMIQQNVGGHPVAVYRFPPSTKFPKSSTITVWSGCADAIMHQPPTDFVWKEQQKWGTGPECTTILCKPNGQAIAWTTAAHRFTKNAFEDSPTRPSSEDVVPEPVPEQEQMGNVETESLTEMTVNINEPRSDTVYLRREKQQPPTLSPQKHPHGTSPAKEIHPQTNQPRPYTYGNDNSSLNRQSRSQTTRPDPIAGQPYAGATGQKMGSAPLRKYSPSQQNIRGNGTVVNKSAGTIRLGPPTPFLSPLQQEFSQAFNSRSTSLVRFTT